MFKIFFKRHFSIFLIFFLLVLIALFSSYLSNRQGQNIGVSESVANGVDNFINTATVLSNAGKKEVGSSVG